MKKLLYKYLAAIIILCVILCGVLKVVDMHRDGTVIRDCIYSICTEEAAGPNLIVWDVEWANDNAGANVHLWEANYGTAQKFYLQNIGNDEMCILYGNNGMCVGVADDGYSLQLQIYEEKESQRWKFERQGTSQYYNIKNCASGLYVQFMRTEGETFFGMRMAQLSDDNNFRFMLRKQGD